MEKKIDMTYVTLDLPRKKTSEKPTRRKKAHYGHPSRVTEEMQNEGSVDTKRLQRCLRRRGWRRSAIQWVSGVWGEGKEGKWRCGCNFPLTLFPSFPSPPPRRQPPGALLGDAGRCGVGGWAAFPLSSGPGRSAKPPAPIPAPALSCHPQTTPPTL